MDVALPGAIHSESPSQERIGPFRIRRDGNSSRGAAKSARSASERLQRRAAQSVESRAADDASLQHQAQRIGSDLRQAVEQPRTVTTLDGDHVLHPCTSIGYAIYPEDTTSMAELSRLADRRMYEDKQIRAGARSAPETDMALQFSSI